uniref:Uncharacterized protein n=1 Tax=Amphiprion ocellaris TaxID=80972 RepID=A0A3Q1DHG9_AMPOC
DLTSHHYFTPFSKLIQHHQDPSFMGRVKRTKDANVSVTLMNVTREDAGEIKLSCRNSDGTKFDYRYSLKVTDPGENVSMTTSQTVFTVSSPLFESLWTDFSNLS